MPTISPDPTSRAPAPTSLRCLVTRNTPHSVGLFPPPVILTAVAKLPMPGSASSTLRGGDGYYPLTPAIIHNCGYTAINTIGVISSYNEIILVHESVMTKWVGPQIDRILEKGLVSLPRL